MFLLPRLYGLLLAFLLTSFVSAFNPSPLCTAFGLFGVTHENMTKDAYDKAVKDYFGINTPSPAMKKVRTQIMDGSSVVDNHKDKLEEAEEGECHFDDETFFS